MTTIYEQVTELSTLLQLYLKQEFPNGGWIAADQETVHFFRKMIQAKKKPVEQQAQKSVVLPTPAAAPKLPPPIKENFEITHPPSQNFTPPAAEKNAVKPPAKKSAPDRATFNLEPFQIQSAIDLQEIRAIFSEKYPKMPILDSLPDIKTMAPQIAIFYEEASPEQLLFLKNLTRAVTISLGKATLFKTSLLSKESFKNRLIHQGQLKLILAPFSIDSSPSIPVVKFLNLEDYLRTPLKKEALWQEIKKAL